MTLTILNTRPSPQNQHLTYLLEQQGWKSIECPAIAIEQIPADYWQAKMPPLSSINQIIFTSHHAVCGFFEACQFRNPINVYAIGRATAKILAAYGINTCIIPHEQSSEGLLQCAQLQDVAQQNILLVKGSGGRSLIESTLSSRGAHIHVLDVYQRKAPQHLQTCINTLWQNDAIDIVLYTSEESMNNILGVYGESAIETNITVWLLNKPALVISKRLTLIAQKKGFTNILSAEPATIIETLLAFQKGQYREG